jgi:hypothetical protein
VCGRADAVASGAIETPETEMSLRDRQWVTVFGRG